MAAVLFLCLCSDLSNNLFVNVPSTLLQPLRNLTVLYVSTCVCVCVCVCVCTVHVCVCALCMCVCVCVCTVHATSLAE